jgi:uncharacterized protein (TIGR03435 family)
MKWSAALLLITAIGLAQAPQPAARPTFEVASIRRNVNGDFNSRFDFMPRRFEAKNASVRFLIQFAWNVYDFQVSGGPGWTGSDHYDIQAVTEKAVDTAQHRQMVQALLEDRFQLQVHRETRQSQVYALVPAREGIKLQASWQNCNAPPDPASSAPRCGTYSASSNGMDATAITMEAFATALSQMMGRRVVDQTGYTEKFDLHLKWADPSTPGLDPDDSKSSTGDQSIFSVLQQQLGLKLESKKHPWSSS